MATTDARCDYYTDLELKPTADATEVKKQFKKLGASNNSSPLKPSIMVADVVVLVALKYHPDRNQGRELEFNAKFQAIQSAHEVLADPARRAKYDAERIKAGLLHTYISNPRPNVPPRTPTTATNFPPPPRAPAFATKPPKSSTSASSSTANRYSGFASAGSWASNKDDAQSRASASKAWEQMKSAQTSQGRTDGRPVPPKWSQGPRDPYPKPDSRSTSRPSWEQFQESYAGFPNMSRGNTSRTPKRQGFTPATPGGDELPARNTSAYFNVNRGERPQASRAQTQFPPPPKGTAPAAKKPDGASRFRGPPGLSNPFVNVERISTPYATGGGERTYFSSSGLHRSTSTRENNQQPEHSSHGSTNLKNSRSQTSTARHHSASPKMRQAGPQRSYSTSSSSSEDSVPSGEEKIFTPSMRKTNGVQHDSAQAPVDEHRRPSLNGDPKVNRDVESGRDELRPNVQPNWSGRGSKGAHESPNQTANEKFTLHGERLDNFDGSFLHRMKRDADERHQQQSSAQVPPSAHHQPSVDNRVPPSQPMEKSRSWQDKYSVPNNVDGHRARATTQDQNGKDTMYDSSGSDPSPNTPSPDTWMKQWPCMPSQGRGMCSDLPLHWATPSTVTPVKQAQSCETSCKPFYLTKENLDSMLREADCDSPDSFTFPVNNETYAGVPSPRSQSSENINTTFSPSDWSGKFTGSGEYFTPPYTTRAPTPRQRASPTRGQRPASQHPPAISITDTLPNENTQMPPPPAARVPAPSPSQVKFSAEEWSRHFQEGTFAWPPPPPGSPGRSAPLKRPKIPRMPSKSSKRRPTVPKPASVSATVDDSGEDPGINGTDSNVESVSSYVSATSGDDGAMDIDSVLTPPDRHAQRSHNASTDGRTQSTGSEITPRPHAPLAPPMPKGQLPAENTGNNEGPNLDFADLKNVAPLAPGNEGLKDLGDLSSALPFQSRSANTAAEIPRPKRLELPNPPKAPSIPKTLNQNSWDSYIAQMRNYMYLWKIYDSKILNHFKSRQTFVETSLGANWMSGAGDGYAKYMQGLEEDVRVRMHWNISCEKHHEAMMGLGSLRERLLKSSIVA